MKLPKISVIIPTYNRGRLLLASIKSVQEQSFKDLEIIVVDDASTDGTSQILKDFPHPEFQYIRHEKNLGANAARNTGVRAARGEFVAFQDSDDRWHPQKLQAQMDACSSSTADVAFCAFTRIRNGSKTRIPKKGYKIGKGSHNLHASLVRGSFISTQTLLIRKKLLLEVGVFDESLPRLQDWELCLRLSEHHDFAFVEESLVDVEIQKDSISSDTKNFARAAEIIIQKHAATFRQDPVAGSILYLNVATEGLKTLSPLIFFRYLLKAIWVGGLQFPNSLIVVFRRG